MYKPQGIIHITGEPDVGKTILALTAYPLEKTIYFFDDVKRPNIDTGGFVDLVEKYSDRKLLGLYDAIRAEIDNIKPGQFDCIIFDTWTQTGKAIRYYAKLNPYEFRERETFSKMGSIKGKEEWGETHRVEAFFISELSRKCKAVFLITHIKEKILGGVKSGSYEPDCGKSFSKICNLRVWLRHNPDSAVPIMLPLKRIIKMSVGDDNIVQPINVLPRRIVPHLDDTSIWQTINRYWNDPVGNRSPDETEKPTEYELSILDGILTKDQKEVWHAELRARQKQEKEEREFLENQNREAKAMVLELANELAQLPLPLIAQRILPEISKVYPDLTTQDIIKMLGE